MLTTMFFICSHVVYSAMFLYSPKVSVLLYPHLLYSYLSKLDPTVLHCPNHIPIWCHRFLKTKIVVVESSQIFITNAIPGVKQYPLLSLTSRSAIIRIRFVDFAKLSSKNAKSVFLRISLTIVTGVLRAEIRWKLKSWLNHYVWVI